MPYKATGKWVMVKRKGKWVRHKLQRSEEAAKAMARALNMVVKHK